MLEGSNRHSLLSGFNPIIGPPTTSGRTLADRRRLLPQNTALRVCGSLRDLSYWMHIQEKLIDPNYGVNFPEEFVDALPDAVQTLVENGSFGNGNILRGDVVIAAEVRLHCTI